MEYIVFAEFLASFWLHWRDYRTGLLRTHRWTIPNVSRRRAAVLGASILSWWLILGIAILVGPEGQFSTLGYVFLALTMLSLQVALGRRSEFFQPREDDKV